MAKPALFIDLVSGDSYQFAAGREDTLQIQNLEPLVPAAPVNLFIGSSGGVTLGGALSSTLVEGADVSLSASALSDLTFTARGSSLTFNQVGSEALVGFAPSITSMVAALNDVKAAVGLSGLQGAYNVHNIIAMTVGRNLTFTTLGGGLPAELVVQNPLSQPFVRTDTPGSTVQLGSGSAVTVTVSGYIKSDLNFDPGTQYHYVQRTGTANGTPATPDALYIKGLVNGANTAGADLYLVAERNAAGPNYGGTVWLASYLGPEATGVLQSEISLSSLGVQVQAHTGPVQVISAPASDIVLGARGGSITVNQLGAINLAGWFTSTSLVGALNELQASLYSGTLQQAYTAGNTIDLTTARNLQLTTFDGVGVSNVVVQNQAGRVFLQTDTTNSEVQLGDSTNLKVDVNGRLVSDLRFDETDNTDRSIWISGAPSAERTLFMTAAKSGDNAHGSNLVLSAVRSPGGDGGDLLLTSYDDAVARSYLSLYPAGGVASWGMQLVGYGRSELRVDAASPLGSALSITNQVGPVTVDSTGGTLTFNATGQAVTLDCTTLDFTTTAASQLVTSATWLLGAANDLTFGARGATITLNQLGDENLDPGFTSTSIVGALNELIGSGGAGTLQQSYNLGNTIGMTSSRSITFTTFDGAGVSNFLVQNSLGRLFIQTDTSANSVRIGDVLLDDVVFSGRGASLTFNQLGNTALMGFAPTTTSLVAALNELKASPSGGVTAIYVTAEPITLGDAVYMTAGGTIGVADQSVVGKEYSLGFATQTVGTALPCVVALGGEVFVKTSLLAGDVGLSAFLSTTGDITTTAPGMGAVARVGLVVASGIGTSKIALQVGPVVIL